MKMCLPGDEIFYGLIEISNASTCCHMCVLVRMTLMGTNAILFDKMANYYIL